MLFSGRIKAAGFRVDDEVPLVRTLGHCASLMLERTLDPSRGNMFIP
jgi:hypothetical protein